jgi:hypothetical protein
MNLDVTQESIINNASVYSSNGLSQTHCLVILYISIEAIKLNTN